MLINLVSKISEVYKGSYDFHMEFGSRGAAAFNPERVDETAGETRRPYRYLLYRRSDPAADAGKGSLCAFVLLNPSTADANQDDPTIRRCIGYAKAWGHMHVVIANIFAYRATDPRELYRVHKAGVDPIGKNNDHVIAMLANTADELVCGWGAHGDFLGRGSQVKQIIARYRVAPKALRVTKDGHPSHPLYLPGDLKPGRF